MTGSYSNFFRVHNIQNDTETILQADKSPFKSKPAAVVETKSKRLLTKKEEFNQVDALDFGKKIIHSSWHPKENIIALAATNNLFLFEA